MNRLLTTIVIICFFVMVMMMTLGKNNSVETSDLAQLNEIAMSDPAVKSNANFQDNVLKSDVPVFLRFSAAWCPPCKILDKIVQDLEPTYSNRIKFVKIDVDEEQSIAQAFQIASIPQVMYLSNGKIVKSIVGLPSETEIHQELDRLLAPPADAPQMTSATK